MSTIMPAPLVWYWLVISIWSPPATKVLCRFRPPLRSPLNELRWMKPSPLTTSLSKLAMPDRPMP